MVCDDETARRIPDGLNVVAISVINLPFFLLTCLAVSLSGVGVLGPVWAWPRLRLGAMRGTNRRANRARERLGAQTDQRCRVSSGYCNMLWSKTSQGLSQGPRTPQEHAQPWHTPCFPGRDVFAASWDSWPGNVPRVQDWGQESAKTARLLGGLVYSGRAEHVHGRLGQPTDSSAADTICPYH